MRKAYGFGSMVMGMIRFDGQSAVFALPGATMGAMGAAAMSRATGADADEAERLRRAELEASYRSASALGFDELIDPREIRNVLLHALERALFRRQAAPEPVGARRHPSVTGRRRERGHGGGPGIQPGERSRGLARASRHA